ncbi:ribonuclease hi large subunit, putative [Eimeria acervulina]|uniref:Ribonuclease n=1 Tax=Eimeria acervulina TaxID=5801 RepID=U6GL74_EIMAC|nr:ribonuclease hi large subunit, putative [Eimeria acervulina]CDI80981.1 ribonuclease hi large subunit, putative [Eimeria acervulina]
MKVDDSKRLTEEQREAAFAAFMQQKETFGRKVSLNEISHAAAAGLIAAVCSEGVCVSEVYVDTVGKAESYQAKLQQQFPSLKITVSTALLESRFSLSSEVYVQVREKADSLFPVVSAASILAKVTRDRALRSWPPPERPSKRFKLLQQQQLQQQQQQRTGRPKRDAASSETAAAAAAAEEGSEEEAATAEKETVYGSGYPGDSLTISFMKQHMDLVFGFPSIVRWSWQTAKEMFEKEGVATDWYEEVEEEGEGGIDVPECKQSRITSFFQVKQKTGATIQRPKFFVRNRLELITSASRI